jgi:hypothetical protein
MALSIRDWGLLYYVWVNHGGETEHGARRRLRSSRVLRYYEKDGRSQRGRELVRCDSRVALQEFASEWKVGRSIDLIQH